MLNVAVHFSSSHLLTRQRSTSKASVEQSRTPAPYSSSSALPVASRQMTSPSFVLSRQADRNHPRGQCIDGQRRTRLRDHIHGAARQREDMSSGAPLSVA